LRSVASACSDSIEQDTERIGNYRRFEEPARALVGADEAIALML
jgi:hypothetical protein